MHRAQRACEDAKLVNMKTSNALHATYFGYPAPGQKCALERTRTSDLQVRNLLLYPLSYERLRG